MKLRLRAPAKINWTMEILDRRPDGYHEVRTLMQAVDLSDSLTLAPADEVSLRLSGETAGLESEPAEVNLALRAARLLRQRAGCRAGVRILLEKAIPVAAGLGGGSSDAAATLRGLHRLWKLSVSDDELTSLAAELGSDVPFFLRGEPALASGRGDALTLLTDGPRHDLVLAWPQPHPSPDKTGRMYAALRPEHRTDGSRTEQLAARLRSGEPVRDEEAYNVFETVLPEVYPEAADVFKRAAGLGLGRPHLCGSGPGFFFLLGAESDSGALTSRLEDMGLQTAAASTLAASEATSSPEP